MKRIAFILGIVSFFVFVYIHTTPLSCKALSVTVEKSDSIHDVATKLKENTCIRSKELFENYGVLFDIQVREGLYSIPERKSFFTYLFLFEDNVYRQVVRITIPEGSTNREIAELCQVYLSKCDEKRFLEKTKKLEGYLFPETYEFIGNESEDALIAVAQKEFTEQTQDLLAPLSELEKKNVVVLASILEKEADTEQDMYIVSGVLYKRLKINMALQVDATLFYERGKTSAQLSVTDLTKDSLYNTYTNRGLPPTAISNPGLIALKAAVNPENSPYLFYLTGKDGKMYYAATFNEHIRNKELYLR